jgi:thymidylate kinase
MLSTGQRTPGSKISDRARSGLFAAFFSLLEHTGICYAILSNYFSYPDSIQSDVDFVVPERDRRSIPRLVQAMCFEADAHLVQISEYRNTSACSCFVAMVKDSLPVHLRFDVCSDDHRNGELTFKWQFMLEDRRKYLDRFFVPAPEKSLVHYLLKRVGKRSLGPAQLRALNQWYRSAPKEAEELLCRYWPSDHEDILEYIANEAIPNSTSLNQWAKKVHLGNPRPTFVMRASQQIKETRRKIRRTTMPMGYLISFMGPDGCGKSTAIAATRTALVPAFAGASEFHRLPRTIHKGRSGGDGSRPHEKTPRGPLASIAKVLFWFADLTLGYWLTLRPKMVRCTLIIFDRYFHDVLVDRLRYRYGGPSSWVKLLSRISPQPDLWILLDAPAEVLWQRKPELSLEEGIRQRAAYRELISPNRNAIEIDATQPVNMVVACICAEVFRRLEYRTNVRYGLGQRDVS